MMRKQTDINETLFKAFLCLIIFFGCFQALNQYVFNRSLWLDEAMLSLNIISRSFFDLLEPLDMKQAAPIGFLFIQKAIISVFGDSEFSLRVFPLLCYFATFYFIYHSSKKINNDKVSGLIALTVFCVSYRMVYYSSEVKQYMSDLLICSIIMYYTLYFENNKKWLIGYSILGVVSIWFSNVSVISLSSSGIYLLIFHLRNVRIKLFFPFIIWMCSFIIYYIFFIHNHTVSAYMKEYWKDYFLDDSPLTFEYYEALGLMLYEMVEYFRFLGKKAFMSFTFIGVGFFYVLYTNKRVLILLLLPIFINIILASLSIYPLGVRLVLHLSFSILVLLSSGLFFLYAILKRYLSIAIIPIFLLIFSFQIKHLVKKIPFNREEIKPNLTFLDKKIKKEEKVIITEHTKPAFMYYRDDFKKVKNVMVAKGNIGDLDELVNEIINKGDGKFWLLISHIKPEVDEYITCKLLEESYRITINKRTHHSFLYKVVRKE